MKLLVIGLFFYSYAHAMDLGTAAQERNRASQALEQAGKIKVYEGPDHAWHLANSFIQAVVCPVNVIYTPGQIEFPHYKRPYITFYATYAHAHEWLDIIGEKPHEEVMARADDVIDSLKPYERITEFHKFLVGKSWLYLFTQQEDAPSYLLKKKYLAALHEGDCVQLTDLAQKIVKNDRMTLIEYINQKREMNLASK